jgi:hypothetical protein
MLLYYSQRLAARSLAWPLCSNKLAAASPPCSCWGKWPSGPFVARGGACHTNVGWCFKDTAVRGRGRLLRVVWRILPSFSPPSPQPPPGIGLPLQNKTRPKSHRFGITIEYFFTPQARLQPNTPTPGAGAVCPLRQHTPTSSQSGLFPPPNTTSNPPSPSQPQATTMQPPNAPPQS